MLAAEALWASLEAVLALVVPPQIHLALEAFGANVAAERLEARVFPAVGDQVGALAERFATHLAFVRLFTYEVKQNKTVRKNKVAASSQHLPENQGCLIYTINGAKCFSSRCIKFASISMGAEWGHCSDLSNINWQQMHRRELLLQSRSEAGKPDMQIGRKFV